MTTIHIEKMPNGYYLWDELDNAKYFPYTDKRDAIKKFRDKFGYTGEHGVRFIAEYEKHEIVNSTRGLMILSKGTFDKIYNSEDE